MTYTSKIISAGKSIIYPATKELYVFSPYYLRYSGVMGDKVQVSSNGITLTRYVGDDSCATFPIQEILQSYFADEELGRVGVKSRTRHTNRSSKLIKKNIVFTMSSGGDSTTVTFDAIWGALQPGKPLDYEITIYKWNDSLPLTVTCNIGTMIGGDVSEVDTFGKEFYLNAFEVKNPVFFRKEVNGQEVILKKINVEHLPYCEGGIYLRWISPTGDYKYFYFDRVEETIETEKGVYIHQNVWSMESTGDEIKKPKTLKSKDAAPIIVCGIKRADYNMQLMMQDLQQAILFWVYENDTWIEVEADVDTFVIDRYKSPQEIIVRITKQQLYLQSR